MTWRDVTEDRLTIDGHDLVVQHAGDLVRRVILLDEDKRNGRVLTIERSDRLGPYVKVGRRHVPLVEIALKIRDEQC